MALQLKLKPGERVIIGQAVIRNGHGRTQLLIENEVVVLREADILGPRKVSTPCERIYLALQLLYVDPANRDNHLKSLQAHAEDLLAAAPSFQPLIAATLAFVARNQLYQALKSGSALLAHEREILDHV